MDMASVSLQCLKKNPSKKKDQFNKVISAGCSDIHLPFLSKLLTSNMTGPCNH